MVKTPNTIKFLALVFFFAVASCDTSKNDPMVSKTENKGPTGGANAAPTNAGKVESGVDESLFGEWELDRKDVEKNWNGDISSSHFSMVIAIGKGTFAFKMRCEIGDTVLNARAVSSANIGKENFQVLETIEDKKEVNGSNCRANTSKSTFRYVLSKDKRQLRFYTQE